jgi:hypothetical protein
MEVPIGSNFIASKKNKALRVPASARKNKNPLELPKKEIFFWRIAKIHIKTDGNDLKNKS